MKRSGQWLAFGLLSWILWMDQTVYTLGGAGQATGGGEGASSAWQQIAVLPTKGACEAQRQQRVQDAARQDASVGQTATGGQTAAGQRGRYHDQFRFFCSPAE
jgi:hypothetical protein